jgi:N4-gp56 family major capsid protein
MSASNITMGATNASLWTTYILKKFVPGLKAKLFFTDYARPAMMPRGAGNIARWLVPSMAVGSTTALVDGTSGAAANAITITGVEGTIADYGEYANVSDLAEETEVSTALDAYTDIMTYRGAGSLNTLIYNAAKNATNFLHAGDTTISGVTLDASDFIFARDFPTIAAFFHARDASGFDSLGGDFMLAMHPDAEAQLISDVTNTRLSWSEVNKHVPEGFKFLVDNHKFIGRLAGVTALRTTLVSSDTEADVVAHFNVALADYGVGWLGLGEQGPRAPQIKYKTPGPHSTNDPLDTNNTIGWKVRAVAANLDAANRSLIVYSDVP